MFQVNGPLPFSGIQSQGIPVKGITIQPNQVVFGKVYKLYQNGVAEVQIRDVKVYAQVETELKEGQNYYFMALKGEDGKLLLKVLEQSQSMQSQPSPTITDLLKALKLPDQPAIRELVQFFLKENVPIIKDKIEAIHRSLGQEGLSESAKKGILTLLERNLPITKETVASIVSLNKNPSMSNEIMQLLPLLKKDQPDIEQRMLKVIQSLPVVQSVGGESKTPFSLNQFVSNLTQVDSKTQPILVTAFQQMISQKDSIEHQMPKTFKEQWQALTQEITKVMNNTREGTNQEALKQLKELVGKVAFFIESLNKEGAKELGNKIEMNFSSLAQVHDKSLSLIENKEQQLSMLKNGVKELGLNHERDILRQLQPQWSNEEQTHSLKSLLLEARERLTSSEARGLVEQLLLKITGQQLLGKEPNSPFLFYTTIFPVFIENTLRDFIVQWGGRKTEKDGIDADYCRVVFLLELNHLGETIVDMSVQNRIVSLSIYNDHGETKDVGNTLYRELEEGLKNLHYILSGVKYLKGEKNEKLLTPLDKIGARFPQYSGVDLKI